VTLAFALFFLRKKKRLPMLLCFVLLLGIGGMASGCGGGGASGSSGNPGTPAGTSKVTVTASSGTGSNAISQTVTVSLTVQ
jgi:ABC-type glycerol-3-phosphate transport system substrate-binding protein